MNRRLLVLMCVLGALAALPSQASAAPAVQMKCAVKGQLLPTASIINRGTISYSCTSTYLGTTAAVCTGTITGTTTSGTCTRGMLTVVSCSFSGTFLPSTATTANAWKGALKIACGLSGMPTPRVDCSGDGGGLISSSGAISGTITGYCEIPGTA